MSKFTAYDLKRAVAATGSVYFNRSEMKAFGDTMSNYGVRAKPVMVERGDDSMVECWVLYRRNPVFQGVWKDTYFDCKTFEVIRGDIVDV